ncbi:MAG TPA: hypothetical protein VKW78_00360 [Terriglobales bacterium]|nr:hypothetical protein [Terriglobales bacterium]
MASYISQFASFVGGCMNVVVVRKFCLRLLLATVVASLATVNAEDAFTPGKTYATDTLYQSRIPLGWESFVLSSAKRCFYLLGSVENREFQGWRKVSIGSRNRLLDARGQPVRMYPDRLQFRITASARERMLDNEPFPFPSRIPLNAFLLGLRFRLKVFRGLEQRTIYPAAVVPIGMPADINYDERIYRIDFNIGRIPIEDRLVLEVLSPTGQRISKFHVDLF